MIALRYGDPVFSRIIGKCAICWLFAVAVCAGCVSAPSPRTPDNAGRLPDTPFVIDSRLIDKPVFVFPKAPHGKPPVLLLHEMPGLSPETIAYAEMLSRDFTVYVPLLFGDVEMKSMFKGMLAYAFNGDWDETAAGGFQSRRITRWLCAVLTKINEHHPSQPVGIIGMCLTGDLPLALAAVAHDPHLRPNVHAVVLAQPTLPITSVLFGQERLGISDDEYHAAIDRVNQGALKVYAVHFKDDWRSRHAKIERLKRDLRRGFCDGTIDNSREHLIPGEAKGSVIHSGAHSSLVGELGHDDTTTDAVNFRRQEVVKFLVNQQPLPPRWDSECRTVPF